MIGQTITEMHIFCQWEITVRQTPWMKVARGLCRKHRRGAGAASTHVLPVDLIGPRPMAIGTDYTYALVAVYYTGIGGSLPYVQGLASKNGTEVMTAIIRVIREILWTCGNVLV